MPNYHYKCPSCGWEGDRNVPVEKADEQECGFVDRNKATNWQWVVCHTKLTRVFTPTSNIVISECFRTTLSRVYAEPRNEEERKRWDENGVGDTPKPSCTTSYKLNPKTRKVVRI